MAQYTESFREQACRLVRQEGYLGGEGGEVAGDSAEQPCCTGCVPAGRRISRTKVQGDTPCPRERQPPTIPRPWPMKSVSFRPVDPPSGDGEGDFKKSDGLLLDPPAVRYHWGSVQNHQEHYPVRLMCEDSRGLPLRLL